ncbi:MAG: hypothetical protein IPK60_09285 [Sandaracinaceae bacterium]|nr:hypothetical protein [Sandaracinaceae bacterium]
MMGTNQMRALHPIVRVGAVVVAMLASFAGAFFVVRTSMRDVQAGVRPGIDHAAAQATPIAQECETQGAACVRHGRPGVCLSGRCVLDSGVCSFNTDCDDSNACTHDTCAEGRCLNAAQVAADFTCTLADNSQGVCTASRCVRPMPPSCAVDRDCPDGRGVCSVWSCVESRCVMQAAAEGAECELASTMDGTCHAGACVQPPEGDGRDPRHCRVVQSWYGPYQSCIRGTRFTLTAAELLEEAKHIEAAIHTELLYDVRVALVPISDGGYNVLVFNRQDRSAVQGLVDPSFVAFTIAGYTERSTWKSRTLQIWVRPYEEGWAISTSGGRQAVREGRRRSALGAFGVVDIRALREWLQRHFRRIDPPAPEALDATTQRRPAHASR